MDKNEWSIAEARLHLSEVIKRAKVCPQILENRNKPVGAIIDSQTLERLQGKVPQTQGAQLVQRLAALLAQDSEDVSLPSPLKSMPSDPFEPEDL